MNRRSGDDQAFVLDWHDPVLFTVAMAIVGMSCLDAFFTLKILAMGGEEINWFMERLIENDTLTFIVTKYVVTGAGVIVLAALAGFRFAGVVRVRRILELLACMYACLMVYEVYLLVEVAGARLI